MVVDPQLIQFFREMESSGIAGFAPENMASVVAPLGKQKKDEEIEEDLFHNEHTN